MQRIILVLLFAIIASCCEKEFITRTTERDTTVYLPGAVVRDTLSFHDSTFVEHTYFDTSGRAALRIYKDRYNRLIAECSATPDTIRIPIERTTTVIKEYTIQEPVQYGFFQKYGIYSFITTILLVIGIVIFIVIKIVK